jgi:uncharacterized protein YuzE
MKLSYDHAVDALFLRLSEGDILESEEVKPGIIFDYDKDGRLVGIEILDVKHNLASNFSVLQAAE